MKEPFGSVLFPNRSPVAGTDLEGLIAFLNIQMPDSDESCRIIRPASHTTALGLVFIAENGAGAQGEVARWGKFTEWVHSIGSPMQSCQHLVAS